MTHSEKLLKHKEKLALDEMRMLVLGSQVLIGFQLHVQLEKGYHRLPEIMQTLSLVDLGLMLVGFGFLLAPMAYVCIVDEGNESTDLLRYCRVMAAMALFPFATAIGMALAGPGYLAGGAIPAIALGGVGFAVALAAWYGAELFDDNRKKAEEESMDSFRMTPIFDKVDHVLTEQRVVLPGAQALLGFQTTSVFMEGFDALSPTLKSVHLACLCLTALSVVLLMVSPAYHRIVERGEERQEFYDLASALLLAAMVPLGLGMCGEFYVLVTHATASALQGGLAAGAVFAALASLWFVYPLLRRRSAAASSESRSTSA